MESEIIIPEKIIPGGQALATLKSGKKIFLWGALPGETITDFRTIKNKSTYAEAVTLNIINPSPHRVNPKDSCFLSTSPWQIIEYSHELELKQALVVEIFREHGINIPTPQIFTDGQDYFYRNKMEYSLYWNHDTSKIQLAFHERGSHRKVPIKTSSLERPEIFHRALEIVENLNARGEEARKYQSLLLRCNSDGEVSGGLYENRKPHPKFTPLTDQILGQKYSYSPNGFFQINLPVYEMALKEIKKYISTDNVLDLYAGVGTIGLSVARDKNLTLVEVDKSAFSELRKNISRVTWAGDAAKKVRDRKVAKNITVEGIPERGSARVSAISPVADRPLGRGRPLRSTGEIDATRNGNILAIRAKSENIIDYIEPDQTVILDPPRAGCDKKLIEKLLEIRPTTIIYLSCNPATQARDVKHLLEKYHLKTIKTFNFFPHTPHIENLVVLC